jgi:hypothetical protein
VQQRATKLYSYKNVSVNCVMNMILKRAPVLLVAILLSTSAWSDEKGGGDLRSAVQNPISSLISVPFKFTFDYGANNGDGTIMNINPVVPVTVGNWNLVNRALIPVASVDGAIQGPNNPSPAPGEGGSASGLGDINYSLYFSPVKYDKLIWGVGPSLNLPTASDDQLGSGKWSTGITAVALTVPSWGSMGILGRQLWSFAGESDRKDVNQTLIEPFLNYNLDKGWFLLTDIVMTANWEADSSNRWTIPLGGGVGRVFKLGNQAINSRLEAYYNAERSAGSPDYTIHFTWQFLFPKK